VNVAYALQRHNACNADSLREVLSQQAGGIFVVAVLPRAAPIAEVESYTGGHGNLLVLEVLRSHSADPRQ